MSKVIASCARCGGLFDVDALVITKTFKKEDHRLLIIGERCPKCEDGSMPEPKTITRWQKHVQDLDPTHERFDYFNTNTQPACVETEHKKAIDAAQAVLDADEATRNISKDADSDADHYEHDKVIVEPDEKGKDTVTEIKPPKAMTKGAKKK